MTFFSLSLLVLGLISQLACTAPRAPGSQDLTPPATRPAPAPAIPAAATPAAPSPAPAPAFAPLSIAAIGDSLTSPTPRTPNYLSELQKLCPRSRIDNFGVGGNMVNQMRARFERTLFAASRPRYTHVILFGGVNDLYSDLTAGRTVALIERDLSAMYQRAREANIHVVAVTVTPWGGFKRYFNASRQAATLELNRWILEQPSGGQVGSAVDAYPLLSCGTPERLCPELAAPFKDGLHFGPKGHERLARALHAQVFGSCL